MGTGRQPAYPPYRRRGGVGSWCAVVAVALLAAPGQAMGHHSVLGFDASRSVSVQGTVTDVVWSYPHVYLSIRASSGEDGPDRWIVEVESPPVLERLGWEKASIRPGDRIHASGAPARNGDRILRCDVVETAAGSRLPCYPRQSSFNDSRPLS